MSITKLSPNWACQMGPIHCPKFLLPGVGLAFKLIVCEGQKSPYVWGKTPVWVFCPTSVRAFFLTDGPKAKIIPTTRHFILFGFKCYTRVYDIPNGYNALRATIITTVRPVPPVLTVDFI